MLMPISDETLRGVVGTQITGLSYADAGFLVLHLDSGENLWLSADDEGYQFFVRPNEKRGWSLGDSPGTCG